MLPHYHLEQHLTGAGFPCLKSLTSRKVTLNILLAFNLWMLRTSPTDSFVWHTVSQEILNFSVLTTASLTINKTFVVYISANSVIKTSSANWHSPPILLGKNIVPLAIHRVCATDYMHVTMEALKSIYGQELRMLLCFAYISQIKACYES